MDRIKKNSSVKKKLLIVLAVLAILVGVYMAVAYVKHIFPFSAQSPTYAPGTHIINENKTGTEKQATSDLKTNPQDKVQNNQTDTPATPSVDTGTGKQQANVVITNASLSGGDVSVSGFVTNVVESDGLCVYTFTNGSSKVIKTTDVLPNATSTTCATTTFPASDLSPSGTWSVVLSYSSPESAGISAATEFQK